MRKFAVLKTEKPDFIQAYYSIVTREAEERLLPLAADSGIGVIVNRPFETSGLFSRSGNKTLPAWAAEIGCTTWPQFFSEISPLPSRGDVRHPRDR